MSVVIEKSLLDRLDDHNLANATSKISHDIHLNEFYLNSTINVI